MTDIATIEPESITAGSTIKWTKNLSDYKPEDGWVLTYSLFNATGQETIAATDNGDSTHLVNISAATYANYTAGDYQWQSWVTKAGERFDIDCGDMRVNANPAAAAVDGRSHVKKTLDAINTTIETRATKGNESYSIDGFSITRNNTEDLLAFKIKYEAWYSQEKRQKRAAKGLGHSGNVRVRL